MDGTLTPARKKMQSDVVKSLIKLQKSGYEIGIVTGSDMNYVQEQCDLLFDVNAFDYKKVHWLPCNGTKYYRYNSYGEFCWEYKRDMVKVLGEDTYNKLLLVCFELQGNIAKSTDCPLTGNFFNYRGSMLNWCPIGRAAKEKERLVWREIDQNNNVRHHWKNILDSKLKELNVNNITVKLGGETSFDIYPSGWDKTHCLENFKDYSEIIFIGDKCFDSGNDREIYEAVKSSKIGKAYQTNNPQNTIEIINLILKEEK